MPGRIIAVLAEAGADVAKGQPLIVMEAMKDGAHHQGSRRRA